MENSSNIVHIVERMETLQEYQQKRELEFKIEVREGRLREGMKGRRKKRREGGGETERES